jgi:Calcium-activated chloride channel
MRLDAFKLCKGRRRPLAEKTGGIGVWEHLLNIVAVISVLTNCWLMGFTSAQSIWIRDRTGQLAVFAIIVLWEHVMLLIRYILSTATSTLPKVVRDAIKKERHTLHQQRSKLMRARRHQRDHEETTIVNDDACHNLTELNRRALYNNPIVQASTAEEEDRENT